MLFKVISVLLIVASCASVECANENLRKKEIFLPPDCDVVTLQGKGIKLELTLFDQVRADFGEAAEEAAKVETPRNIQDDSQAVVNENLFKQTKQQQKQQQAAQDESTPAELAPPTSYGPIDEQLLRWLIRRTGALINRLERYNDEIRAGLAGANRVVVEILLLNTLVDLENLLRERILEVRRYKTKLNGLLTNFINRESYQSEVEQFTRKLIEANKSIEDKLRGKNEPGTQWVKNSQAIRRILHEQRYSQALGQLIINFFSGSFNLMSRSSVYENNKPAKRLDDGLVYFGAKNRVSPDFPFSSQDTIANGAFV